MARPRIEVTPAMLAAVVALVEAGDPPPVAANVGAGIGRSKHFLLMADDEGYRTAITRALDIFKSQSRAVILAGDEKGEGFGPAKARLEALGRMFPKEWGQRVVHEIQESNRLMFEVLQRVCSSPEVYARVREDGDLGAVIESVCSGLAGLDGEGEAPSDPSEEARVH